jgi:hypothetical protein
MTTGWFNAEGRLRHARVTARKHPQLSHTTEFTLFEIAEQDRIEREGGFGVGQEEVIIRRHAKTRAPAIGIEPDKMAPELWQVGRPKFAHMA